MDWGAGHFENIAAQLRPAAELARVLRPGGRLVLTAWQREGALGEAARFRAGLIASLPDAGPAPAWFAWHDPETLTSLLAPHGFTVAVRDAALPFTDTSPKAFTDAELADHPAWVAARALLEPAGRWAPVPGDLTRLFADANEDPSAFRLTGRYVIATATMSPA